MTLLNFFYAIQLIIKRSNCQHFYYCFNWRPKVSTNGGKHITILAFYLSVSEKRGSCFLLFSTFIQGKKISHDFINWKQVSESLKKRKSLLLWTFSLSFCEKEKTISTLMVLPLWSATNYDKIAVLAYSLSQES